MTKQSAFTGGGINNSTVLIGGQGSPGFSTPPRLHLDSTSTPLGDRLGDRNNDPRKPAANEREKDIKNSLISRWKNRYGYR